MFNVTIGEAGLAQLTLFLIVSAAVSIVVNRLSESGWRNRAESDLRLYSALSECAKTEKDFAAMELLKRSAVSEILRAKANGSTLPDWFSITLSIALALFVLVFGIFTVAFILDLGIAPLAAFCAVVTIATFAYSAIHIIRYVARMLREDDDRVPKSG